MFFLLRFVDFLFVVILCFFFRSFCYVCVCVVALKCYVIIVGLNCWCFCLFVLLLFVYSLMCVLCCFIGIVDSLRLL